MSTHLERLQDEKYLISLLFLIVIINLVANGISQDLAVLAGNYSYIPVAGILVYVSLLLIKKLGTSGKHGMAWISLFGFAAMWFVAEMTWMVEELFLNIEPFPSTADIFYLLGYPFLLMFLISYLVPFKSSITKKTLTISILISLAVLFPSLFLTMDGESDLDILEYSIAAAYPIADAFVIVPAIIGVVLFFRGEVNFMWTLVCFGIICVFIADTSFMFAQIDDWYYTGHPMEILFLWTYVLIAFGVYDQIRVFKRRNS